MLGKLMKYELRATSRTMLPLLLLTLLLSVFTRMTSAVVQSGHSKFITVINTLLIFAFFLALIGTAVFSVVLMVVRFRNNLMTDEGYLMFTLPVSVHQLLWSIRRSGFTRRRSNSSNHDKRILRIGWGEITRNAEE